MSIPETKSSEAIDEAISTILASDEYQFSEDTSAALSRGIGELFQELISVLELWLNQVREVNPVFFLVLVLLSGSVLIFVAWWSLSRSRMLNLILKNQGQTLDSVHSKETAEDMRLRAESYASEANYLESIRWMFRAYLYEQAFEISAHQGTAVDSQTYQELGDLLQKTSGLSEELLQLLNVLEQGLYGERQITKADHSFALKLLTVKEEA